jgi:DinB superfamily
MLKPHEQLSAKDRSIRAVDGQSLLAESCRMLEYLRDRSRTLTAGHILERTRAAALELEGIVASVHENDIRRRPFPGKWHIADVVDHISQTQIRGAEELRHLLSGRRPPGPPVYEALKSGASEWALWPTLVRGLQDANREMLSVIEIGSAGRHSDSERGSVDEIAGPTVCTIVVANCKLPDGQVVPQIFITELDWKQYALLQRLHLLDHRTQIRKLLGALHDSGCALG